MDPCESHHIYAIPTSCNSSLSALQNDASALFSAFAVGFQVTLYQAPILIMQLRILQLTPHIQRTPPRRVSYHRNCRSPSRNPKSPRNMIALPTMVHTQFVRMSTASGHNLATWCKIISIHSIRIRPFHSYRLQHLPNTRLVLKQLLRTHHRHMYLPPFTRALTLHLPLRLPRPFRPSCSLLRPLLATYPRFSLLFTVITALFPLNTRDLRPGKRRTEAISMTRIC